jgi:hypothetical protein
MRLSSLGTNSAVNKILAVAAISATMYAVICGALFALMLQSPDSFARTMRHVPWPAFAVLPFKSLWMMARSGRVGVGNVAPDFSLESPDHKSHFQLSSLRGQKPVVLVFGSYT